MGSDVQFNEDAVCARCGRYGAFLFETEALCGDCYEARSACCPEFGGDDFWAEKTPSCDRQRGAPDEAGTGAG